MNSQQLHDALSHLPDDLIEEADRLRSVFRRSIPFCRYLPMAACFVLVLASALFVTQLLQPKGATETAIYDAPEAAPAALAQEGPARAEPAMKEAPAEECAPADEAPSITGAMGTPENSNSTMLTDAVPALVLETPRKTEGTASYASSPRVTLIHSTEELADYLPHYDYQYHFENAENLIAAYDSHWFEMHDLLLLAVHTVPTGSSCKITSFAETDGIWEIHVAHDALTPENPYTTDYHLLLTVEKDQIPGKNAVTLILDIQNQ